MNQDVFNSDDIDICIGSDSRRIENLSNFANLFKSKKLKLTRSKQLILAKSIKSNLSKSKKSDLEKAKKPDFIKVNSSGIGFLLSRVKENFIYL